MANQSKLKAWLRYDGTGRVVTAGPIFQANKPKVGNWRQISADLCCNSNGTTTTTTTHGGGGGVTPTAFIKGIWTSNGNACTIPTEQTILFYSASSVLQPFITIFLDAALTTPVPAGYVINADPYTYPRLKVLSGGYLEVLDCVVSFPIQITASNTSREEACSAPNTITVYASSPTVGPYSTIYLDPNLTILAPYSYVAVGGNSYQCVNGNLQTQQSCVVINSQTFYIGPDIPSACSGSTSQILYWNGTFQQNGTAMYTDAGLTQPVPTGTYIVNPTTSNVYVISNGAAFANGFCGQ